MAFVVAVQYPFAQQNRFCSSRLVASKRALRGSSPLTFLHPRQPTMTTSRVPPTLLSPLPADAVTHDSISLLPLSLAFDGPAPISAFFQPRPYRAGASGITSKPTSESLSRQEATFRGRLLISTRLALPEGYRGVVFSTATPVPPVAKADTTAKKPAAKRLKSSHDKPLLVDPAEAKARAEAVARGLRRSPRKAAPVKIIEKAKAMAQKAKKYSLDSDSEDEEEPAEDMAQEQDEVPPPPDGVSSHENEKHLLERMETDATLVDPGTPVEQEATEVEPEQETQPAEAEDDTPMQRDTLHLKPLSTFNAIDVWQADCPGSLEEDVYARALTEWCGGLGAKVSGLQTSRCCSRR